MDETGKFQIIKVALAKEVEERNSTKIDMAKMSLCVQNETGERFSLTDSCMKISKVIPLRQFHPSRLKMKRSKTLT